MYCLFCGHDNFKRILKAPSFVNRETTFDIFQCQNCGIARTNPLLNETELSTYYKKEYYGSREKKFVTIIENAILFYNTQRAKKIFFRVNPANEPSARRVLDIGCGRATLLNLLSGLGCECHGIERSGYEFPSNIDRIFFYTKPLKFIHFEPDMFDVVIMWHSLEHISDPADILEEIYRILKPNGLFILATPNFESVQRHLFGPNWFHLDLPRHTHHFGRKVLVTYLEARGFRVECVATSSLEQNPYGFIQSLFNVFPWTKPNRLYSLLKARNSSGISMELLIWIFISCLFFPIAFLEYIISGLFGRGAIINLYACKD